MLNIIGFVVGVGAYIWYWNLTDWKQALALALLLFANNLGQRR